MPVKCEEYGKVCVIEVVGDLVAENIQLFKKNVQSRIDSGKIADFVVDLNKAAFIDSEGLEALLSVRRQCEELGGEVKLMRLDETCKKILELTRLEHRFECPHDLATAMKTMR